MKLHAYWTASRLIVSQLSCGSGWCHHLRWFPVGLLLLVALPCPAPASPPAGTVVAWGITNNFGQLDVPADLTKIVAISAGENFSITLAEDGTVAGWGEDDHGQLCPPADLTNVIVISAGGDHCLALQGNGVVRAWGKNHHSQVAGVQGQAAARSVAARGAHSLVLKNDGALVSAGSGAGELVSPADLTNVIAIATGREFHMALKADGTVAVWGYWPDEDNYTLLPTFVPPNLSNVVAIAAGSRHCAALRTDGTVVTWGTNVMGIVTAPAGLSNVVAITARGKVNYALRADGSVVAWGKHTELPALSNVIAIARGENHGLALIADEVPLSPLSVAPIAWGTSSPAVHLSVPTRCGKTYLLEHKDDLSDPRWTPHPLVAGNGSVVELTHPMDSAAQRFFRVRVY
jgi:alpha-tubulin suppressor-like RCC1 family protein